MPTFAVIVLCFYLATLLTSIPRELESARRRRQIQVTIKRYGKT